MQQLDGRVVEILLMLAAGYVDLTDREMKNIRYKCLDEVRKSHGFILFEKALAVEKSAGE